MSITRTLFVVWGILSFAPALQAQTSTRPPHAPPGTVTLTLEQYDRLVERAAHPPERPAPPPLPAVVARADLQARMTGDRVRGTCTLAGEILRPGFAEVPLLANAAILEARIDRGALPLVQDGPLTSAVIEGPGPFSIEVHWGAPVESAPGRASFTLPVSSAGSVTAVIELPGQPAELRVEPGVITSTSAAGANTRVEVMLVPGTPSRVSWSSRQTPSTAGIRALRTHVDFKSLVSVGETDVRLTSLVDVTVVRGETDRIVLGVPAGFTMTTASGPALDRTEEASGTVVLVLRRPAERRHQFVVSFERSGAGTPLQVPLPTVATAERETGEVAVEAAGTIDLTAHETELLRRMDVREVSPPLRSLARQPLLAALRYRRRALEPPVLSLHVNRFPDAPVVAAVAERAIATTLVTAEGRMLTEVALTMRNRAQPFMRVNLPPGATMVSAEVAGEAAKLAEAGDGARVPLLRPGFRPDGPYVVSFVYTQSGEPFLKKGRAELALPRMGIPIAIVEWEMLLPDRYRLKRFEGDAVLMPAATLMAGSAGGIVRGVAANSERGPVFRTSRYVAPGEVAGTITDAGGSVLPGARVHVIRDGGRIAEAVADASGEYRLRGLPSGQLEIAVELEGFSASRAMVTLGARGEEVNFRLSVSGSTESVTVAASPHRREERDALESAAQAPSQNVFTLQRRVSGVLPVRIDVPRAGLAYRFARPLVMDEVTQVTFEYRTR